MKKLLLNRTTILYTFCIFLIILFDIWISKTLLFSSGIVLGGDFPAFIEAESYIKEFGYFWDPFTSSSATTQIHRYPFFIFLSTLGLIDPSGVWASRLLLFMVITLGHILNFIVIVLFINNFINNKSRCGNSIPYYIALLASTFYVYNPFAIHRFPQLYILIAYMLTPLFTYLSILYIKNFRTNQIFKRGNILLAIILAILLTIAIWNVRPTFYYLLLYFYSIPFVVSQYKARDLPNLLLYIFIPILFFILFNLYWIMPFLFISQEKIEITPTYETTLESINLLSKHGTILNNIRLVKFWALPELTMSSLDYYHISYSYYILWVISSFIFPILSFASLLFYRKNRLILFFSSLALISIMLALGTNLPHYPISWIFRNPERFLFFLVLCYNFLLSFSLTKIFSNFKELGLKLPKYTFVSISIAIIIYLLFANIIFTHVYISLENRKNILIPENLTDKFNQKKAKDILNKEKARILILPQGISNTPGWANWEYRPIPPEIFYKFLTTPGMILRDESKILYNYIINENISQIKWYMERIYKVSHVIYVGGYTSSDSIYEKLVRENSTPIYCDKIICILRLSNEVKYFSIPRIIVTSTSFDPIMFVSLHSVLGDYSNKFSLVFISELRNSWRNIINNTSILIQHQPEDSYNYYWITLNNYENHLLIPSKFTKHHLPNDKWSIGDVKDLLYAQWHPYLKRFGMENWQSDYNYGLVFTWAKEIPKNIVTLETSDLIAHWGFNNKKDFEEWENATLEKQFNAIHELEWERDSLKVVLWNSTWGWKVIKPNLIEVKPYGVYHFELKLRGENASGVHVKVIEYDKDKRYLTTKYVKVVGSGTFDWKTVTFDYKLQPGTKYLQLQIWHGHETKQPLPNIVWIDDVKVYDITRYSKGVTLEIPFEVKENEDYKLLIRYFENQKGGEINVYLDGKPIKIKTENQLNKFVWKDLGTFYLEKGKHEIVLENVSGFNAVNLFTLIPENEYYKTQKEVETLLQNKTVIYLFESESDLYRSNAKISNNINASNGKLILLDKNSKVWQDVEIVKNGTYKLALKGFGDFEVSIGGNTINLTTNTSNFTYTPIFNLEKGKYTLNITSLSDNAEIDVVWLYSAETNQTIEQLFEVKKKPAEIANYTKINPTLWKVKINATKPFMLSFAEAYNSLWEARIYKDDKLIEKVRSIPLYSVINGFLIGETGNLEIVIRYAPQDWFELGSKISGLAFIGCIGYIFYDWRREKGDGWAKEVERKVKSIFER